MKHLLLLLLFTPILAIMWIIVDNIRIFFKKAKIPH